MAIDWTLWRLRAVQRLGQTQHLYRALQGRRAFRSTRMPQRDTAVLVDGFPRSANTFARCAIEFANPGIGHVAHHLHAPGQIRWAVNHRIPTIMLIREPDGAALSEAVRPWRPQELAETFRWYIRFYESLLDVRDRLVVGEFRRVTSDYGSVIEELNERFGTSLTPYESTPENDREVFAIIDGYSESQSGDVEFSSSRPSEVRAEHKRRTSAALEEAAVMPVRQRAHELFASWTDDSTGEAAGASK